MVSKRSRNTPNHPASSPGPPQEHGQRHLSYFAHAPLPVMVVDVSGRFVEVNPAACRIGGYEEAELLAMSFEDVLAEESLEAGRQFFARVKEVGQASGEFCWTRKDGSRRWSTCEAAKLSEDRFLGFFLDVTEHRQAEEALQRSQAELRAIYDHAPVMMCVITADRRVVYCNHAMSAFIGKPEEDIKGHRAGGILGCIGALDDPRGCGFGPQCASCSLRLAILDTFQTGKSHKGIDYRRTLEQDGNRRNVALLGSSSFIRSNVESIVLLCLEDVSERTQADERIRANEREIKRLNRLYAALSELNQSIARVKSREELFQELCRITTQKARFQLAWVGSHENETHRVAPVARGGDKQDYLDEVEVYADDRPEGRGPTGRCIREDKVFVVNDFAGDPCMTPWHAAGSKRGFRSVAALPIRFQGKVWGALTIYDGEPNTFQDKEVALLEEAAAAVSLGMDGLDQELRRQQAELAVEERLRFEQLLADLLATMLSYPSSQTDEAIDRCLKTLVEFLEVDRINVAELGPDDTYASITHTCSAPGVEPFSLKIVYVKEVPWYVAQIRSGRVVYLRRVPDDFPGETIEDRQYCHTHNIKSLVGVPLRIGTKVIGHIAFHLLERHFDWQPEIISRIQLVGEVVANAMLRKRTEQALRESERQFSTVFRAAPVGLCISRLSDGRLLEVNDILESLLGYGRHEALGHTTLELGTWDNPEDRSRLVATLREQGRVPNFETRLRRKSGGCLDVLLSAEMIDLHGEACMMTAVTDITERKRAEQEKLETERRMFHTQKLESLGILAGGIAHDFNNILAGIMGYAELALTRLPPSDPIRSEIEEIDKASRRAADLTRQMLAYAGKGTFIIAPLNLSRIVEDNKNMLAMSVSKKAGLKYNLAADVPAIQADPGQVTQVLMNLVINASEALREQGGVITIATGTHQCDGTIPSPPPLSPAAGERGRGEGPGTGLARNVPAGLYVFLEVADTGCGMDNETLGKIFDPFFSTKFTGRGLGLAAVQGIVRSHKGAIQVSSQSGQGTTFRILFPASDLSLPPVQSEPAAPSWHGTGLVLIVDDEEMVRTMAQKMLEYAGFSVLTASDGQQGIELYREHQAEVVCVLLDLTMPEMDGVETFHELCRIREDVRVILFSGYSEQNATRRFSGMKPAGFIQKPYRFDTLISLLREVVQKA